MFIVKDFVNTELVVADYSYMIVGTLLYTDGS